jgi:hypothetical protein
MQQNDLIDDIEEVAPCPSQTCPLPHNPLNLTHRRTKVWNVMRPRDLRSTLMKPRLFSYPSNSQLQLSNKKSAEPHFLNFPSRIPDHTQQPANTFNSPLQPPSPPPPIPPLPAADSSCVSSIQRRSYCAESYNFYPDRYSTAAPCMPRAPEPATAGSLSVLASLMDSIMDIMSGIILMVCAKIAASRDPHLYPGGKSRAEPIGIVVFSVVMGTGP